MEKRTNPPHWLVTLAIVVGAIFVLFVVVSLFLFFSVDIIEE